MTNFIPDGLWSQTQYNPNNSDKQRNMSVITMTLKLSEASQKGRLSIRRHKAGDRAAWGLELASDRQKHHLLQAGRTIPPTELVRI